MFRRTRLTDKIGTIWCRLTHHSLSWPVHDQYRCHTCLRQYPVPWAVAPQSAPVVSIRSSSINPGLKKQQQAA